MPLMQLPEDVRALEECPFPVEWQPVASILQFQTPEIFGDSHRDTLKQKELVRWLQVVDLLLRTDPSTPLGQDVRTLMEEHVQAGNPFETFM